MTKAFGFLAVLMVILLIVQAALGMTTELWQVGITGMLCFMTLKGWLANKVVEDKLAETYSHYEKGKTNRQPTYHEL